MVSWFTDRHCFTVAVLLYGASFLYSLFLWRKGFRQDDRVNYLLLLTGFLFHTVAMAKRGFSFQRCPVTNLYEAITFVIWTIVACYLVIGLWPRFRFLGAFASPVLLAIGVFALFPELDRHGPRPDFTQGWSSLHASLILLAYGAFGLGSVAGAMYLTQERDLKRHKLRAIQAILPSMNRLEQAIGRLLVAGFALLTLGLILGGRTLRLQETPFSFWDVKIIWSILVWALYLGLLVMRLRFSQRGRRLALGAVGSFAFVLLTFWGTNLMSNIHHPE
jgi:HemX protein